jgi:glycerol uptake facilitator protein
VGELAGEFLGTLILLSFGAGVCAMVALFGTGVPGEVVHGGWTSITLGWGLGWRWRCGWRVGSAALT